MLSGERPKATIVYLNFSYLKSLVTVVLSVLCVLLAACAFAQPAEQDSLIHLDEVVITHTRLQNYATGHFIQNVDSVASRYAVATNAAELLRKFGYGHIRSYGVGGVTTPSFRGTGGSHTAVLWNGISIVSPLLGQSDLSLLPVTFIDDIQLQSGGSASIYGAGAIGGTIQFNNKAAFNQGLNLSLTENGGSFKSFFHGISASFSNKKFSTSTKIFQSSAENNFPFLNNNYTIPQRQRREHNATEQHGVLQQNYFHLNRRQLLSLRFWYQDNHYEVPEPITVNRDGKVTQRDQFFRSMIGWNYDYDDGHLFIQSAHVHHLLYYNTPGIFDSFVNTIENTLDVANDLEWTSGANYTFESSNAAELLHGGPHRNRVAFYTAIKHEPGRWTNVLSVRQEIVNGKVTPFAPSLGTEYRLQKNLSLFGSVSRSYRIPTFNDLYWNDALAKGNPGLRMETSWSEEAGAKVTAKDLKGQVALFSNQVDDLIYWIQENGWWTPNNVRYAWTRGVESTGTLTKTIKKTSGQLTARYSYTLTPIVFTPRHESGVTLTLSRSSWQFSATNNYTGRQRTDENNGVLKASNITNVWLSKTLQFRRINIVTMIEMNNIFDRQVSSRPGYPLPGRNFKAGLTIRFNKQPQS